MKKIAGALLVFIFINSSEAQDKIQAVKIGGQKWMARNLDVSRYRNGDIIPEVKDAAAWSTLTTGAWCYARNDSVSMLLQMASYIIGMPLMTQEG
jgi:hypothetical protein